MTTQKSFFNAVPKQVRSAPLLALASVCFSLGVLTAPYAVYLPIKLFAVSVYALVLHWLIYRPRIRFPAIEFPLAALLWTNLISAWWAANLPVHRLTWYMLLILGIIPVAMNVIRSEKHLEALCQGLFLESAAGGLWAIIQFGRQYRMALAQQPDQRYHYMLTARLQIR